jgi:hypothetical protein
MTPNLYQASDFLAYLVSRFKSVLDEIFVQHFLLVNHEWQILFCECCTTVIHCRHHWLGVAMSSSLAKK